MLDSLNPAVRIAVLLLTGGTVAWALHSAPRIVRRLFLRYCQRLGAWLLQQGQHEQGLSLTNDADKSSQYTKTRKRDPATWSYSGAMEAGISGSLNESQKVDVLNAWRRTRQAASVAVSGTATGCGDVSVRYTNPGQRSVSLTSCGPEREN